MVALGEGALRVFERIYTGEKTLDDTEWAKGFLESRMSKELIAGGTKVVARLSGTSSRKDQRTLITGLLKEAFSSERSS